MYKNIYTSTTDNTLRNLQYKFVNRIIPTNKSLMKYNIKNNNTCDFCNMYVETIKHLFLECNHVQHLKFWNNMSNWLKSKNLNTVMNFQTVSLGVIDDIKNTTIQAKNYTIILAKNYIYQAKSSKQIPNFTHFKNGLTQKIDIER